MINEEILNIRIHRVSKEMRKIKIRIKEEYDIDDDGYEIAHSYTIWKLWDRFTELKKTKYSLCKKKGGKK